MSEFEGVYENARAVEQVYALCESATGPVGRAAFPEQAAFAQRVLDLMDGAA